MTSWLKRTEAGIQSAPTTPAPGSALTPATTNARQFRDPNAPDNRLECETRCIYERQLPGGAYITAHVTRLQYGFYDSPATHGDLIENVRFVAVKFVFHPSSTEHRFQAATVTITLHDDTDQVFTDPAMNPAHRLSAVGPPEPARKPKFLRFAPHIMFGAVSPETLDWNFNLTGSLGVSQGPANASISPSGGVKTSYKVYQMMRIQGSTRTARARHLNGTGYDMEDGEIVWTMEENALQKSGLPREMTFVMLTTKGEVENVVFDINIEPKVASRLGHYPNWFCNLPKYQPLQAEHTDVDKEIGQVFSPVIPGRGFNFANLAASFDSFVSLPGTTYSLTDQAFRNQVAVPDAQAPTSSTNAADPSKSSKPQSKPDAAATPKQAPDQSKSTPSQQPAQQSTNSDEPADYHIYLHNPRSINLHATPPPPPQVKAASPHVSQSNSVQARNPLPKSNGAALERTRSPANTSLKRRSISINYMGNPMHHPPSQSKDRKGSGGSLRRSRSRSDLRSTTVAETSRSPSHSSESSRTSSHSPPETRHTLHRSQSNKDNLKTHENNWSSPPQLPVDHTQIPIKAPSPPGGSSNVLSPPLPSNLSVPSQSKPTRLPFEMRRNHSSEKRPERKPRSRDSPSPLRKQREITPSPSNGSPESQHQNQPNSNTHSAPKSGTEVERAFSDEEETIDMRTDPASRMIIPAYSNAPKLTVTEEQETTLILPDTQPPHRTALRDISPYGYANANRNGTIDEDWDEAKGDLKKMRARKRLSMPVSAHYSYIGPDTDADRDWEER